MQSTNQNKKPGTPQQRAYKITVNELRVRTKSIANDDVSLNRNELGCMAEPGCKPSGEGRKATPNASPVAVACTSGVSEILIVVAFTPRSAVTFCAFEPGA